MVALETSKLFSGLSAAELEYLRAAVQLKAIPAGNIIFTEGDEGDGLYVVQEGTVQISALVNPRERRVLSKLMAGDFFGEMAILDNGPRSATATAEKDAAVYFIPRTVIVSMLESSPHLAISLMREFSLRLREFNRRYIEEVLQAERLALVGRFARSIVHDFKNPLNVIGIASDIAAMESSSLQTREMARQRIRKQIDTLSGMINELLEFTRGPQGAVVLANTNYRHLVQRVLDERLDELKESSITLACENEPPDIPILLDPNRMLHVFTNLINNAMDAMPNGGAIRFRFEHNGSQVTTEIIDTGPGIAPEIQPRLFEAFATFGKAHGTGLGLSICKRIVEDHGGRIDAYNLAGRGACIRFALPLRPKAVYAQRFAGTIDQPARPNVESIDPGVR